jgi:proteasome lid subunit RPN8/RPN11
LLKREAQKTYPIEACAILFGESTKKEVLIEKVVVAPNRLKSPSRFEINPETFADAFIKAEKEGLDFIGLFHSHPAPATPSAIDLKYMKLGGDAVWLILSSTNGGLAAYQMKNAQIHKVTLKIE